MDFFKFLKKDSMEDLDLSKSNEEEVLDLTKKDDDGNFLEEESFQTPEEKRKKLAKRLVDITEKLEDLSNQIYHLGQRIEVLEKKSSVNY
jgi:predicted  nucleic acid-binding Zn-ribbon protein|tara:strand:- start:1200 stop:1469 length:270 start_codon:yes stop_codon:yes gene_type:complete